MKTQFLTVFIIGFSIINVRTVDSTFTNTVGCGVGGIVGTKGVKSFIVGGVGAEPLELPFMVSLQVFSTIHGNKFVNFCGGSVLNERWILTAAHCVEPLMPSDIKLIIGAVYYDNYTDENVYKTDKWVINGCYKFDKMDFMAEDIALIHTETAIKINGQNIAAICLPAPGVQPIGSDVWIAGWGVWDPDWEEPSRKLQKVYTKIVNEEMCHVYEWFRNVGLWRFPEGIRFCVMNEDSTVCRGDSGGPLMQIMNGTVYQLGIASFISVTLPVFNRCSKGNPAFYLKTERLNQWIGDTIAKYDQMATIDETIFKTKC